VCAAREFLLTRSNGRVACRGVSQWRQRKRANQSAPKRLPKMHGTEGFESISHSVSNLKCELATNDLKDNTQIAKGRQVTVHRAKEVSE
jgi:hypothetical protein